MRSLHIVALWVAVYPAACSAQMLANCTSADQCESFIGDEDCLKLPSPSSSTGVHLAACCSLRSFGLRYCLSGGYTIVAVLLLNTTHAFRVLAARILRAHKTHWHPRPLRPGGARYSSVLRRRELHRHTRARWRRYLHCSHSVWRAYATAWRDEQRMRLGRVRLLSRRAWWRWPAIVRARVGVPARWFS